MPKFIGLEAALVIHHEQINIFGGLHDRPLISMWLKRI